MWSRHLFSTSYRRLSSTAPLATRTPQQTRCYRVAIVGSGPAGCYTAKYLQLTLEKKGIVDNTFDVLERHATIGGLVRYGVAPDHPEVKNVLNDFEVLFAEKGVNLYANVEVGKDISVDELRQIYDVVVLAYGCQSDRKLGIEGEELEGVLSAREFVAWYNGHPDHVQIGDQVAKALGSTVENGVRQASVVVVGQGNVALDCARILAKGGTGLYDTDLAKHALDVIGNGVAKVSIVGRRGHVQGAFTIKELRELVKLEQEGFEASFHVRPDELDMGATLASMEELSGASGRPKQRIEKLLREASLTDHTRVMPKQVDLRFLLNPTRFEAASDNPTKLASVVCERTCLEGEPGRQTAKGTGVFETIPAQLALVSIGYRSLALRGTERWFDGRGNLVHLHGQIEAPTDGLGGVYASGWLKRGPSGIIGTNIADAKDTVATIANDLDGKPSIEGTVNLGDMLASRNVQVVDWHGYQRIVEAEKAERRSEHQPREKIVDVPRQLAIASSC